MVNDLGVCQALTHRGIRRPVWTSYVGAEKLRQRRTSSATATSLKPWPRLPQQVRHEPTQQVGEVGFEPFR
jgi:hypothetical protein